MSEPAIPEELEEKVHDLSQNKHQSNRQIAAILLTEHGLKVSHVAVQSCLKRVGEQIREMEESLYAEPDACPANFVFAESSDRLRQLDRDFEMIARRAARSGNDSTLLRARFGQMHVAARLMQQKRHDDRMALREKELAARLGVKSAGPVEDGPRRSHVMSDDEIDEMLDRDQDDWVRAQSVREKIAAMEAAQNASAGDQVTEAEKERHWERTEKIGDLKIRLREKGLLDNTSHLLDDVDEVAEEIESETFPTALPNTFPATLPKFENTLNAGKNSDGKMNANHPSEPARTRPCPCGSGKKYKRCCAPDRAKAGTPGTRDTRCA